jgi:predicted TIM-barrel fold metal-dependent hydrolase
MEILAIDTHAHFSPIRLQEEGEIGKRLIDGINGLRRMVGEHGGLKESSLQAEVLLEIMEINQVSEAWLHQLSFQSLLGYETLSNAEIGDVLRRYPLKFRGFAGVNPKSGKDALNEIRRCIEDYGFSGVKFNPNDFGGYWLNSRELMYPLLELCCQLRVPVSFHTGMTPGPIFRMKHNNPLLVDDIAVDFPKLTIIIEHMGYPWTDLTYDLVCRHSNTYITVTAIANILIHRKPIKFLLELLKMIEMIGSDRILWGSDWTATPNMNEVLSFIRKKKVPFPLKMVMGNISDADRRKILWGNAKSIIS